MHLAKNDLYFSIFYDVKGGGDHQGEPLVAPNDVQHLSLSIILIVLGLMEAIRPPSKTFHFHLFSKLKMREKISAIDFFLSALNLKRLSF